MSTTKLMAGLARLGIRLEVHGDRLHYHPRSAMTPDLAERMKAHKAELLAVLHGDDQATVDVANRPADGHPDAHTGHCDWFDDPPATWKPRPWCPRYGHPMVWRSIFGEHLICGTCHPPVSDSVVAEWFDDTNTAIEHKCPRIEATRGPQTHDRREVR